MEWDMSTGMEWDMLTGMEWDRHGVEHKLLFNNSNSSADALR